MNKSDKFIRDMAAHFSEEFCDYAAGDEKLHEMLIQLAQEFVQENAPVLDEDTVYELADELLIATTIRPV